MKFGTGVVAKHHHLLGKLRLPGGGYIALFAGDGSLVTTLGEEFVRQRVTYCFAGANARIPVQRCTASGEPP